MNGLIILPQWLITTPYEIPKKFWGVRVVDDRIVDVATNAALREKYPDDSVWEAPATVLVPRRSSIRICDRSNAGVLVSLNAGCLTATISKRIERSLARRLDPCLCAVREADLSWVSEVVPFKSPRPLPLI